MKLTKNKRSRHQRIARRRRSARQLICETLESRQLLAGEWSVSATPETIAEDAVGGVSVTFSLSGVINEGDAASVQLNLQDLTTDPSDYQDPAPAVGQAVSSYNGPGSLSVSPTGTLTYVGGVGGTSMTDLSFQLQPVDDNQLESTESLEVFLTDPLGSTLDPAQSLVTISILDSGESPIDDEDPPITFVTAAVQSGAWHDASTWDNGIPDASGRAIVGDGVTVTLDGIDHAAGQIVVHGTLQVAEEGQLVPLDGGFENPAQPANTFEQASGAGNGTLVGSAWTISDGAGITRNLSGFQSGGIPAPEGVQHALIQGTGEFSQIVTGFTTGQEYEFSLLTMARQFGAGGNNLEVILDAGLATELTLVDISEVTFDSFTEVVSPKFVANKDSYALTIKSDRDGGNLTGDRTTMFDNAQFRQTTGTTRTLSAQWIHVNSGGVFQVGSTANRYDTGEFIVTLTGTNRDADHVIETTSGTMNVNDNSGFLMTAMGGSLQLFGEDKITFTKLAATAEAGSNTITVENIIERNFDGTTSVASDGQLNWEVGDTIVIASSSYDYAEEEVRTITAVNNTGSQTILTLDSALSHRHYGEIETYGNGTRDWDIDLRAEVALLNRSITIQGTQDTDNSFGDRANFGTGAGQNLGVGAHAMFMGSSGQITLDSVRFDQMGQTATLGRYPVHWHVAGDRSGDVMRNSSVTNSNNRGVTIHGTQGVRLEGNVLHDIHGHGFFMEDAAETDNEFLHNIAFGIHKVGGGFGSTDPFVVPGVTRGGDGKVNGEALQSGDGEGSHDTGQNAPQRFVHSAAYWITNPDNTWVGNISAGSEGTGFWFVLPDEVLGLSRDTGLYNNLNPRVTNLLQFDNNTAHSGQVGMTFDRGEDISGGPQNNGYAPSQLMQTNFFTGYKNHGTAVYHRGPNAIFNESRFADNAFSSFNTFSQQEHNVLFVGHSRGNSEPATTVGGYRLYDGPGKIYDSHFAGFTADNAHSFRVEGGANKFTHTTAQGISFENDGTADKLGIEIYGDNFISDDQTPVFVSGRPDSFSGLVYDVDGSLTGHGGGGAGYVLTPKVDYYRDSTDITPGGWRGYISDDRFAQLRLSRLTNSDTADNYIPPFRISNGDGHSIIADRWNLKYIQRMYVKLNAGDYTVEFLSGIPDDGFKVHSEAKTVDQPGDSTVFRFVGVGQTYKPNQGTEVATLDALRAAGSNAWLRAADGDLWMKVFESPAQINVLPTTPLVVTNTNDSGAGSLRAAITAANNTAGIDTIMFDIGASGSTQTIQPLTPLPTITDRVYIDGNSQSNMPIADGGFETAVQPNNRWELANGSGSGDLSGSPWAFTAGAGITRNLSSFQRSTTPINTGFVPAPEGQQHALIQGAGSMSQTVTGFEVGRTYDLKLFAMARQQNSGGGNLRVTLDAGLPTEMTILDIAEVTFKRFTEVSASEFTATKGSYTLTIESDPNGNGLSGDRATFVDNVQFRRVGPAVVIDGSQAGGGSGLTISAGGSGVKSLNINNFSVGAGIHILTADGNVIENVWSGVDAAGNSAPNLYGIGIESGSNSVSDSRISANTLDGIAVAGPGSVGNTLVRNSITGNGGLGIDLGDNGVTPNDALDADSGANDLTNFPLLSDAVLNGAVATIIGSMNGLPNSSYQIEFYANAQLDPSGHGEGETYIGLTTVTTNASGSASFNVDVPFDATGQFITATATDAAGNTSEFSTGASIVENFAPTASIAGPSSGVPFQPRTITLTATDPSPADQAAGFTFDIDWDGDDVVDQTVFGLSGIQVTHQYGAVGANTIKVTASDQYAAASGVATHAVNIVRVEMQGADLVWGGTSGEDAVEFEETAAQTVEVRATLLDGVVVSDTQTFVGVSGQVIAFGGDDADIIDAGGGDGLTTISATLIGGRGDDTIYGGDAADTIRGDAEGDGSEGRDLIDGGGGDDLIYGDGMEGAADTIMGGDGNDTIYGDNGDISADGAEGNDVIYGGDGDDFLYGGRGEDTIFGGDGIDTIDGQIGHDILSGGTGNDSLTGGPGRDLLFAGAGADTLHGNGGDDLLVAGATSFDFIEADLKLIRNEWLSAGSYATRVANIGGTPGGANDPVFLQPGITVFDDGEVDTLFGDGEMDWFLYSQTGLIPDILSDLDAGELETDIAP